MSDILMGMFIGDLGNSGFWFFCVWGVLGRLFEGRECNKGYVLKV